ncbi:glycosyltransferase [Terriglobus albidus]|uniref:glycosyltransferase n=1 Tax=Terriglobus albidus TaxID=1592106 RepID=UPI0021DF5663|nr:glycosyltransferase [Terriglobus albidus]
MRVLQLVSSSGFYGTERMICLLSAALQRSEAEVYIGVFNGSSSSCSRFVQEAERQNLQVLDLACKGRWDLRTIVRLARWLRKNDIEVLHTHGYKANIYGLVAARLAGCALVATCHNWTNRTASLRQYAALDQFLLRHFDRVVAVSQGVLSNLRRAGVPGRRIRQIPNGIEVAAYKTAAQNSDKPRHIILGCLSRLSKEKGVDVLVWALPKLLATYPELQCVVAGEGPERERLLALAAELCVSHALHLPGFCDDTARFLSHCTLVIQPSRIEAMPLAVLEAMASEKPIIASAVGEIPRLLEGGKAGLLVPPGNPDMLAAAILKLLSSQEQQQALAARAAEKATACFDVSVMLAGYLSTYKEAMAKRHLLMRVSPSGKAGAYYERGTDRNIA